MAEVPRSTSLRFARSESDRVLLGVAGGTGERIGVDPLVVRLAFVLLALAGGVGFVAYLVAVLASQEPEPGQDQQTRPAEGRRTVAFLLILAGALLLLRTAGLWLGDGVVWPAALAVFGSVVLWTRADLGRSRLSRLLSRSSTGTVRLVTGAVLIAVAIGLFAAIGRRSGLLANAPAAASAVVVVLVVVVGPWVTKVARQAREGGRERIRSEERAAMAAHLHDSVLQTLALIQRTDEPGEMVALARGQERELRTWLYGKRVPVPGSLSAALDEVAAEVEEAHRTRIEVVMVGDCEVDDGVRALVHACREAMVNAARHSGARGVSVYVEVEDDQVTAFVRDQGVGFSRSTVPPDRHGIAESIEGRMERNGGVAVIESEPGRGTEVRLRIPRALP
jgi:signal transduction histidine kinase/phage shock protein PspC (stress-responsive transcriptional regulator)